MRDLVARLLGSSDSLTPRGWTVEIGWLHGLSDLLLWLAFLVITVVLLIGTRRRVDLPARRLCWLLGSVLVAWGILHFVARLDGGTLFLFVCGLLKLGTALLACVAAIILIRMTSTLPIVQGPEELERRVEELRRSEERHRTLFEGNPHPVLVYDVETMAILAVNEAAVELYGYSREEFLRLSLLDVRPADDVDALLARLGSHPPRVIGSEPLRHRKKDGTLIDVVVSTHDVPFAGRRGRVMLVTDVTERQKVDEERRRLEARMQQAEKLESLGLLAGGVAHDFNNLLTGILGNASLAMLDVPADSPARGPLEQIEQVALRAADLTRQMLAYAGKGKLVYQRVDLSQLTAEMARLLRPVVSKGAVFQTALPPGLPPIEADATQLRQVVMNLITNASDALPPEGGTITLRTGVIDANRGYLANTQLGAELPEGRYLFLEVSDTGSGMDEATREKIFDPFFTTKVSGRGLGLAAVLGIIRSHRGTIGVESTPGKGSTFRILFPAATDAPPV